MIAMSPGSSRRTSSFVRLPSFAGPVCSTTAHLAAPRGTRGRRASARARRAARASSSSSILVCVGSPGTFSTRKWRSATLAICGRCVIVITCARSASRFSVSATAWAVVPPMPASISSKTSVSPPPTAAIASATRESSPPEAVSATGPNGSPGFGRMRNATSSAPVAPGVALARARRGTRRRPGRCREARSRRRRRTRPRPLSARREGLRGARRTRLRLATSAAAAAAAGSRRPRAPRARPGPSAARSSSSS